MNANYAIAYQIIGRNDHIISKTREFKTEKAMQKFAEKLQESGNLYQILGYSYKKS